MTLDVPEGTVLGSHLILIYVNDLNQTIKLCKNIRFFDDTNLPHFSESVNKLNGYVNFAVKNLDE